MTQSDMARRSLGAWIVVAVLFVIILLQGTTPLRWGDGLELVAVSSHLGVTHPPGYPLFTALLHVGQSLLPGEPYQTALWVCRLAALVCALGLFFSLRSVLRLHAMDPLRAEVVGGLFAAAFLLGGSLWPSLHVVEVYVLHGALLAWIAHLLVWSHEGDGLGSPRRILIACVLLGLALAHHLTSVSLVPLVLVALLRYARSGAAPTQDPPPRLGPARRWVAPVGMMLVVAIPAVFYASLLARTPGAGEEGIAWGAPSDLASLLAHVRGAEYGSSQFLMADPFTPFTLRTWFPFFLERIGQFVQSAGGVFVGIPLVASMLGWIGVGLALLGASRTARRMGTRAPLAALFLAIALQLGFVVTYNIADIDDYFLAIHVLALPATVAGLWVVANGWQKRRRADSAAPGRQSSGLVFALLPLLLVGLTLLTNAHLARPESTSLTERYQARLLRALPPNAAIVTGESGDLFLLWYTRFAQHRRADLLVFPSNLHDRPWVRSTLGAADPRRQEVRFSDRPMERLQPYVDDLRAMVLDPLLARGRVFTTIRNVDVLESLAPHYEFRQAAELLRREEIEQLRNDGVVRAPSLLWELRARRR